MTQTEILQMIVGKKFRGEFRIEEIYNLPLGWTEGTCRKRLCDLRDQGFISFEDNAGTYKKVK